MRADAGRVRSKTLLENLQELKKRGIEERTGETQEESLTGLANRQGDAPVVATHYYNPDDERSITGVGQNKEAIDKLYSEKPQEGAEVPQEPLDKKDLIKKFLEMDESEIKIEDDMEHDPCIEKEFTKKIAKSLVSTDWHFKELALKQIFKQMNLLLDDMNKEGDVGELTEKVKAATNAVGQTCKEKVIKVFQVSLQLFSFMISSQKVEKNGLVSVLKNQIVEKNIVLKLL